MFTTTIVYKVGWVMKRIKKHTRWNPHSAINKLGLLNYVTDLFVCSKTFQLENWNSHRTKAGSVFISKLMLQKQALTYGNYWIIVHEETSLLSCEEFRRSYFLGFIKRSWDPVCGCSLVALFSKAAAQTPGGCTWGRKICSSCHA